jgi:chromosomal replication initiator protein
MLPDLDRVHDRFQQQVRQRLVESITERRYRHWFDGKAQFRAAGNELLIHVGNPYLLTWIQKQFSIPLGAVARELMGSGARVRLEVVPATSGDSTTPAPVRSPTQKSVPRSLPPAAARSPQKTRQYADLRQFVGGPCNELALAAAAQVTGNPGEKYNPLYLYGGVGNGKTHLLEGIYRRVRKDFPALQVLLLTAENFANYFTQALTERTLPGFRQRFRNIDVLLVDDVDFFDGKRVIQEEFLHTLKKLEREVRQIVVTADRHPRLLTRSGDELVTRYVSGLVCRIDPPDLSTRRKILRQQAQVLRLLVDEDALDFVADRFVNNVREMSGALHCLQTYQVMTGKRIGVAAARTVLSRLERDCLRIVRIPDIESAVCRLFGLTPEQIKSSCRERSLTQPRMLAMYLARRLTQSAYSEIGRYFGGRNHATVMSAERKIARLIDESGCIRVAAESWPVHDVVATLEQQILAG